MSVSAQRKQWKPVAAYSRRHTPRRGVAGETEVSVCLGSSSQGLQPYSWLAASQGSIGGY